MSGPHGGSCTEAGQPWTVCVTDDTHSQLFTGPSLSVPGVVGTSGALHPFFGISHNNTNSSVMGVDAEHTALSSIQPIVSAPDAMDDTSSPSHDSVNACMYYFKKDLNSYL